MSSDSPRVLARPETPAVRSRRFTLPALAAAGLAPFALAALLASGPALGQGEAGQEEKSEAQHIVEYRQSLMSSLGANASALSKILRQEAPFPDQAAGHAQAIAALSGYVAAGFPEGTGYDAVPENNHALPEIWSERAAFESAAQDFDEAAQALAAAAEGGDRGEITRAFGQVGQACSACHDDFRYRD